MSERETSADAEELDQPEELDQVEEVDELVDEVEVLRGARDADHALARRVQADFENFRKRALKQQEEQGTYASARLAEKLLPVLDACDNAIIHGIDGVTPIYKSLIDILGKEGLEVIPTEGVFDPNLHEAVVHEPGDGGEPQVVETLRTGYLWNGRVLRAAMVKVRD